MERVLPTAEVKGRVAALAVGLSANCDAPENEVEQILRANLPGARMLPFVALLTHDGKWVGGYAGHKDPEGFLGFLDSAERSPALQASEGVRKKLAALAATAGKAAAAGDWKVVLKAGRDGAKLWGRCPEREALAAHVKKARDWAAARFDAAIAAAQSGGDAAAPRAILGEVKRHFAGEPEAAEADTGLKAIQRLAQVVAAESGEAPPAGIRDKAIRDFRDTRWKAVFEEAPPSAVVPEGGAGAGQ